MKKIFLLFMLLPILAKAQTDTGVRFEHNLSWTAIQAKAKEQNKYIFMDCFTTWCGPCRYMSTKIFPQKESGDFMNDKFISVKVQLDTTAGDADNIKAWYADGHDIAVKYGVRAYPTCLVFAPDGHIIHRMVGSRLDAKSFITDVSATFDSTKQYYTLLDQYKNGRCDTAFLHDVAMASFSAYDPDNGKDIAYRWLATQSDLLSHDALWLQELYTRKSTDKYFSTFSNHATEADEVLGPGVAETKVRNIFLAEISAPKPGDNRPPDWVAIHKKIAAKLPADEAAELTLRAKISYYMSKNDFPHFENAMVAYMKTYSSKMTDADLNNLAWSVFQNCADMSCVSDVLDWSKRLRDNNIAAYDDTYANILYKLGKKDDAIALETKAMTIAADSEKASFQEVIDKMKKGEKTW